MVYALENGRKLRVNWMHSSHNFETRPKASVLRQTIEADAKKHGKRRTFCEIADVTDEGYATLAQATAVLAKGDTFRRDLGRDYSFVKAIKASPLSRVEQLDALVLHLVREVFVMYGRRASTMDRRNRVLRVLNDFGATRDEKVQVMDALATAIR